MEISAMTNLATSMAQVELTQSAGMAVLKKALDSEASTALALLQALPPLPVNLPGHVGQNINTTA